jgi:hypothetical protein
MACDFRVFFGLSGTPIQIRYPSRCGTPFADPLAALRVIPRSALPENEAAAPWISAFSFPSGITAG